MKALLRVTGPNLSREVSLDPSGAEVSFGRESIGRDQGADVQLPDPEKYISRRHLALRQAGDQVELRIISAVNGIETSRGPGLPGKSLELTSGDYFTLGAYRVDVILIGTQGQAPAPTAAPGFGAGDPFATLLGPAAGASLHPDDPFANHGFRRAAASQPGTGIDPLQQLSGAKSSATTPAAAGPLGSILGPPAAPSISPPHTVLAGFGGHGSPGRASGGPSVDDFLKNGSSALPHPTGHSLGNLPLDQLLGRSATPQRPNHSPDHVHGIHLPAPGGFGARQAQAQPAPASPIAAPRPSQAQPHLPDDGLSRLLQGLGAPPTPTGFEEPDEDEGPFGNWPSMPPSTETDPDVGRVSAPAARAPLEQPVSSAEPVARDSNGAWPAFARGLGLPEVLASDPQTAERAGAMVRLVLEGLSELLGARAELKRELRVGDRTMMNGKDNNPLKVKLSADDLVQYLFASQVPGGYMPAERALRESISDLRVHEHATIAASRAAVEGALRAFEPGRLRKQLVKGKSGPFQMLDNARLWEAYQQHYERQSLHMADWLEKMFNNHFTPIYSRETERLKSEGSQNS